MKNYVIGHSFKNKYDDLSYGPGENVPDNVLKDKAYMHELLDAGCILEVSADGESIILMPHDEAGREILVAGRIASMLQPFALSDSLQFVQQHKICERNLITMSDRIREIRNLGSENYLLELLDQEVKKQIREITNTTSAST